MFASSILLLLASAGLLEARSVLDTRHHHGLHRRADALTLLDSVIQKGSASDGSQEIGANEAQQAKSATSTNNFINFCSGKTLTNGLQITTGSCNGIPMGDLPAKTSMVSSIIVFPQVGTASKIQADTTFQIKVQMSNMVAGSFTNADATYFSAPQALEGGLVVGHTHVTVQDMGSSLNPTTALDATQFAFFKGINDAGNGKLLLSANVTGGLPAGNYRVCTMASSSNHGPVIMPVAQRGTADDCTKFTVGGTGTTANTAANDQSGGLAAAALAASAVAAGPGAVESASSSVESKASSSVSSSTSEAKGNAKTTSVSKATKAATSSTESSTLSLASSLTSSSVSKASKATKVAPFANSTAILTTKSKAAATSLTTTSLSSSSTTTSKGGKGKAVTTAASTETVIVKKVVVIETFFEFVLSLGGLPPSVGKNGDKFIVNEIEFDDIIQAAGSACSEQLTTCIGFSGPGFSVEECQTQNEQCSSAASTQTSAASATQITATATVPPTATVTGSVISVVTVTTNVAASTQASVTIASASSQAPQASVTLAPASTSLAVAALATSTESTCAIVTSTIWVDAPSVTALAAIASSSSSACDIVTATVTTFV